MQKVIDATPRKYFKKHSILFSVFLIYSVFLTAVVELISRTSILNTAIWIYKHKIQYINSAILILLFSIVLYFIFNKVHLSILTTGIFFITISEINFLKSYIRCEPLFPWDIKIFGEAISSIKFVEFPIKKEIILAIIFIGISFLFILYLNRKINLKIERNVVRIDLFVIVFVLMFLFIRMVFFNKSYLEKQKIVDNQWQQIDGYKENGFIYSFIMNFAYINVEKPENYNKQTIEFIANNIEKTASADNKPNIIVIMNESFSDISLMKNVTNQDNIMPTIQYLKNNSISGYALTRQFGGGTANSEFEVLTGFSLANLPPGSTPYQQHILQPMPSYASYLKNIGYSTVAIHSYGRRFWNRDNVYKNIGFEKFIAQDNFINPEIKRGFISDMETSKQIIKQYEENKQLNKPFFNFTVTMQNHFAYGENDYPLENRVVLNTSNVQDTLKNKLITYATGIKDADESLKYLMDYFSKVKEHTVIIFFGDHLPELGNGIKSFEELGYTVSQQLENTRRLFSPPFVVCTNYASTFKPSENLSMYQLLPYITKTLNLPKPAYFNYLSQQANYYKGFANDIYIDANGAAVNNLSEEAMKYFNIHKLLQYDIMFGKKYSVSVFEK